MSLKQSLRQTIATLDRIAPDPDRESFTSSCHADDEKASLRGDTLLSHPYQASHDDEKFIRLSTSTLEEPYHLQHSRSRSSLHRSRYLPEVDLSEMETPGDDAPEPKITLHYVANLIFEFLAVPLCFINLAIGACIIGLAADNIDWAKARGSWATDITVAAVFAPYDGNLYSDRWVTKMRHLPSRYDYKIFYAFIVAGVVGVLGGAILAPLSIIHWKSLHRRISLPSKDATKSSRLLLAAALILSTTTLLTTSICTILLRDLYRSQTGYNPYDTYYTIDPYRITAAHLSPPLPPLPPPEHNLPIQNWTWTPVDDITRHYASEVKYNPLNWNCRLQGHVTDPVQHRLWELCEEGNAARWLLVALVVGQGVLVGLFGWGVWRERKGWFSGATRRRSEDEAMLVGAPVSE